MGEVVREAPAAVARVGWVGRGGMGHPHRVPLHLGAPTPSKGIRQGCWDGSGWVSGGSPM